MTGPVRLGIEIWSDVMCPWCVIGYYQLQRALVELSGEIEADILWRPFELNRDISEDGEDLEFHMMRKYGQGPSEAGTRQMQRIAESAGYKMRYLGPLDEYGEEPLRRIWNTLKAHKLLHWALETQGREAQTRLKLALFDAHFQYRLNVSDPETLFAIAERAGLDMEGAAKAMEDEALAAHIREEERAAMEKGITSVPAMLVEGRFMIPGAQEPEVYVAYLRKVVARMNDAA